MDLAPDLMGAVGWFVFMIPVAAGLVLAAGWALRKQEGGGDGD
jgi:hypothetical protein